MRERERERERTAAAHYTAPSPPSAKINQESRALPTELPCPRQSIREGLCQQRENKKVPGLGGCDTLKMSVSRKISLDL